MSMSGTRFFRRLKKRINHREALQLGSNQRFLGKDDATIHLGVPDHVFEDWILNNYREVVDESLEEAGLSGYSIGFEVVNDSTKTTESKGSAFKIAARSDAGSKSEISAARQQDARSLSRSRRRSRRIPKSRNSRSTLDIHSGLCRRIV